LNFERGYSLASNFTKRSSKEKRNKQTKRGKEREGKKEGRKKRGMRRQPVGKKNKNQGQSDLLEQKF
jgi:hypothetical protein